MRSSEFGIRNAGRAALVLCALVLPLAGIEKEAPEVYRERRTALAARLKDGITVVAGAEEPEAAGAIHGFRQNENFHYLTGVDEPGAILLLAPAQNGKPGSEILFLAARNAKQEQWTGPKLSADDPGAAARTGFAAVMPASSFEPELRRLLPAYRTIHAIHPRGNSEACSFERDALNRLKRIAPDAGLRDAGPEIARLRQVKSAGEVALIEKALRFTMDAHRAAMQAVRPGVYEYEIAALMKYTWERQGCEGPAFAPIVGSGTFSTVLHYSANSRRMEAGDVVVIDVGAKCGGYTSDITRTLPVSGRFTPRQREIYDIVLGAQRASIAAIRPGMRLDRSGSNSVEKIAWEYINSHGRDRHGQKLGKYFTHGLGHSVGLDVHDAGDRSRPLEAGMVITIEPGIYLPEESFGIRIEDVVLVTAGGARVLTDALPRDPASIEHAMQKQ